ncbi:uncharacterized protein LOC125232337 [Leguminivora glycinivorella]|uniref:uncharacterized protein LOC125232337 n=1 Tax=Leguminivora glycinivorella TaxID=1035111 RepID=UPI00201066E5|nr:uncharacterized protein LOC125232337 [Leguminivora glycinivorella]
MPPVVFWGAHHSRINSNDTGKRSTDTDAHEPDLLLRIRGGGDAEEAVIEPSPKPAHGGGDADSEEAVGTPSSPGLALPSPKPVPTGYRPLRDALGRYIRYPAPASDTLTGAEDAPVPTGFRQFVRPSTPNRTRIFTGKVHGTRGVEASMSPEREEYFSPSRIDRRDLFGEGAADTGDSEGSVEMGPQKAHAAPSTSDMPSKFWGSRPEKRLADELALSSGSESDAGLLLGTATAKRGKKGKGGGRRTGPRNKPDTLGQTPIVLIERIRLSSRSPTARTQETDVTDGTGSANTPNAGAESDSGRSGGSTHDAGLAEAKRELNRLRREELQRKAEEELASLTRTLAPGKPPKSGGAVLGLPDTDGADNSAASLHQRVQSSLRTVELVATGSANLKGTFVRALKLAVASIGEAVEDLKELTSSEETRRLQRQNANLRAEVKDLRSEVEELKTELRAHFKKQAPPSSLPKEAPQPAAAPPDVPMWTSWSVRSRPGSGSHTGLQAGYRIGSEARSPNLTEEPQKGKNKKRKKGGKTPAAAAAAAPSSATPGPRPLPPAPANTNEEWSAVTRKKSKGAITQVGSQPRPKKPNKPKSRKLRPPRSSAVVLTLQPEAEAKGVTYGQVLIRAKENIDLKSLGINAIKFKKAATGARLLEVPGSDSGEKADSLAKELCEKLGEDLVKISRPTICAELRLTQLDDSVSCSEVVAAVAKTGGCEVSQIKTGEIQQDASGLGSIWLRCPIAAAKKVVEADKGRLQVGWVRAAVKLLEKRPMRCFKCLETGHVRAQCTSKTDLSDTCYRCGKPGHTARTCSATPSCVICSKVGKPADHTLDSKVCKSQAQKPPRRKAGAGRQAAPQPAQTPDVQEQDPMVTE